MHACAAARHCVVLTGTCSTGTRLERGTREPWLEFTQASQPQRPHRKWVSRPVAGPRSAWGRKVSHRPKHDSPRNTTTRNYLMILTCHLISEIWCTSRKKVPLDNDELHDKPAHAVPLASAHQHPENQKEHQAGHSPERAVEGQGLEKWCILGFVVYRKNRLVSCGVIAPSHFEGRGGWGPVVPGV